jgi:TolB protein
MTRFLLRLMCVLMFGSLCLVPLAQFAGREVTLANNEILFTATLAGRQIDTYWMDIVHGLTYRPTDRDFVETQPTWSPDGKQIAYVSAFSRGTIIGRTIYIQNIETMTVHLLIDDPIAEYSPAWSPDGRFIAYGSSRYDGTPELMLTEVQSGLTRRLTKNHYNDNHPTWSPDGRYLAFATDPFAPGNSDIDILDLQTGDIRPLVSTSDREFNPAWSPDGRYILYITDRSKHGIYVWDMFEAHSNLIYPTQPLGPDAPDWSPDGRYIIYADTLPESRTGIFQLDVEACLRQLNSCLPQPITVTPGLYSVPRWRPHQL